MARVEYRKDGTAMVVYTKEELHDIIRGADRPPQVTEVKGMKHLNRAQLEMMRQR